MGEVPIGALSPLDSYCAQLGSNLTYCDSHGSCTAHPHKCPDPPFQRNPVVPTVGACLSDALDFCANYTMPEQAASCQHGVLYAQRPRVLVTDETLRSMSLFSDAFLVGMQRAKTCHSGAMPYF